jgi:hypothetical protein
MKLVELIIVACAAAGLLTSAVGLTKILRREIFLARGKGREVRPEKQAQSQAAGN